MKTIFKREKIFALIPRPVYSSEFVRDGFSWLEYVYLEGGKYYTKDRYEEIKQPEITLPDEWVEFKESINLLSVSSGKSLLDTDLMYCGINARVVHAWLPVDADYMNDGGRWPPSITIEYTDGNGIFRDLKLTASDRRYKRLIVVK
jgi:hypothetical protein